MADIVAFIASDDARWMTGAFIDAAGGGMLAIAGRQGAQQVGLDSPDHVSDGVGREHSAPRAEDADILEAAGLSVVQTPAV